MLGKVDENLESGGLWGLDLIRRVLHKTIKLRKHGELSDTVLVF